MASDSEGRPSRTTRRVGYAISAVVNAALIFAVNVWPGWSVIPFLTPSTEQLVGLITFSLAVGMALNLIYLIADPRWLKAAGDLLTTVIALVVLVRILQVFPFTFADSSGWSFAVRLALIVLIVCTSIGIVALLIRLISSLRPRPDRNDVT